jgi:hypothetical protein
MTGDGGDRLPGSAQLAVHIERRRFLRRSATGVFLATAAAMIGDLKFASRVLADPNASPDVSTGPGCPAGCGPSRCCNISGICDKACCTPDTIAGLKCPDSDGGNCTDPGHSSCCWTYQPSPDIVNTCCDCQTNNNSGCPAGGGYNNLCICYYISHV